MTEFTPPHRLTVERIEAMSPVAQARTWAHLEDEFLLDLDTVDGLLRESDALRIATAVRLTRAGVVRAVMTTANGSISVRVTRTFPIRKAA